MSSSSSRTPVVVLHALGLDGSAYGDLAGALGDRDVHRPDLRGHGSAVARGPVTFEGMADDIAALLAAVGPAHLVGHSMGGAIAGLVAERAPGSVASIAVVATPPEGLPGFGERADAADADGLAAQIEPTLARWFADPSGPVADRCRQLIARMDATAWSAAWRSFADFEGWPALDLDPATHLLCVSYADDRSTPPQALAAIADACVGTHVAVDHGGHMTPLEEPATLAAILEAHWTRAEPAGEDIA